MKVKSSVVRVYSRIWESQPVLVVTVVLMSLSAKWITSRLTKYQVCCLSVHFFPSFSTFLAGPGHADYTYRMKYDGFVALSGGGRASARETVARVAAVGGSGRQYMFTRNSLNREQ